MFDAEKQAEFVTLSDVLVGVKPNFAARTGGGRVAACK